MRYAKVKTAFSPGEKIVAITSKEKPSIPEDIQNKWQKILDLSAKIIGVPSGLITKINEDTLEIFLSSKTEGNIFEPHSKLELGLGWYCESVIGSRKDMVLPNALENENWKNNPSIPYNMISYMGIPILWPDGEVFGTFCMLDNKENNFPETVLELLTALREIIQNDLYTALFFQQTQSDLLKKETQIREIHHRVKNHFNLLISTLNLQSMIGSKNKNIESILSDIQSRISAISLIHDNLYRANDSDLFMLGNYLSGLGNYILHNLQKGNVIYNCRCDDITVPSNISVSCGLILNELITNSIKYAFSNTEKPLITLNVEKENDKTISLIYKDNGPGLPGDFDFANCNSLGILLIKQSVLQLEGKYEFKYDNGLFFKMTFTI